MLSLYCKQARDNDSELRTKILLGYNDLILQTKKAGETKYTNQPLDLFGSIPEFNNELMWPLGKTLPFNTPPKGRDILPRRSNKRVLSSPSSSEKPNTKSKKEISSDESSGDEVSELKSTFKLVTGKNTRKQQTKTKSKKTATKK